MFPDQQAFQRPYYKGQYKENEGKGEHGNDGRTASRNGRSLNSRILKEKSEWTGGKLLQSHWWHP